MKERVEVASVLQMLKSGRLSQWRVGRCGSRRLAFDANHARRFSDSQTGAEVASVPISTVDHPK